MARTCFLSVLTLQKNSAHNKQKTVKLTTWNERPATITLVPVVALARLAAVSAKAPPADCKMSAITSEQMNVTV